MATKTELIYIIKDTISPQNLSNSDITNEAIGFLIDEVGAILKRQDLTKNGTIPSSIIQDLGCIDLELIDKSICPCTLPSDCYMAKTTVPLPKMLQTHTKELITRVGPVILTEKPYSLIPYERVPFEGYSRFNFTKAFIPNDSRYLYLFSKDIIVLDKINVQGVLDKPSDAATFKKCNGDICYNDETEYPLIASQINTLIDMVSKRISIMIQSPIDISNDNKNNPKPQVNNKEN